MISRLLLSLFLCSILSLSVSRPAETEKEGEVEHHKEKKHGRHSPAFLKNVTEEARKEFDTIFKTQGLTRKELKSKVHDWTKKQSEEVQKQVEKFESDRDHFFAEAKMNLTRTLEKLPEIMGKITELRENEDLTWKKRKDMIHDVLASYDDQTAAAARFLMYQSHRKRRGGKKRDHGKKEKTEKKGEEGHEENEDNLVEEEK